MTLRNGQLKTLLDDPHWQQLGVWKLYGVTHSGKAVGLQCPLFRGRAMDASNFAAQIAYEDGNLRGFFLYS